jgi:hypothetical protein
MHDHLLACFTCLACLFVGLSCQLCLPTRRQQVDWFCLLSTSYRLVCLPCLPVCWLILPVMLVYNRLLIIWFCQLCMTNYLLVLPALPACWLAYLASYACQLAARCLADFACIA